jgi:hypothetical protein
VEPVRALTVNAREDALLMDNAWREIVARAWSERRRTRVETLWQCIDVPPRFDDVARQKLALSDTGVAAMVGAMIGMRAIRANGSAVTLIQFAALPKRFKTAGHTVPSLYRGWASVLSFVAWGNAANGLADYATG